MKRRPLPPALALACPILLLCHATPARQTGSRPDRAPQTTPSGQPRPRPTAITLAEEPVRLDSVGLKVFLPEGVLSQVDRAGRFETVQISPQPPDISWAVTVKTPRTTNTDATPTEVADGALDQLMEAVGVKRVSPDPKTGIRVRPVDPAAQVIEDVKPLEIAGAPEPGARFYVRLARGLSDPPSVRGYTVFRAGPGQFVVFELFTTDPEFERVRPSYEIIVARAQFADLATQTASRGVAVEAGITLLASLDAGEFRKLVENRPEQLLRSYRGAPGGADHDAVELGYQRIRARVGKRGELDRRRDPAKWDDADRQEGYLVTIEARTLLRDTEQIVDSLGTYFMTPDRSEEAWSLQMAIRDGRPKAGREPVGTWFETGARDGDAMTVTVSGKGQAGKNIRPVVPAQGYLTQVEALLLPQILVRSGEPGEFGFYTYQSREESVNLRRDTLTRSEDRPGLWVLSTRITEDALARVARYNERGELIRATLPDKTVIEAIQPERLLQIWKAKGLPMD